jgi:hypothetical protein
MGKAGRKWVSWDDAKREAFLDHLAGSCNVKASALAAGVDPASVYALRRKDPEFAGQWHEALLAGYDVLETALIGYALAGGDAGRAVGNMIDPIDVDTGLRLLSAHRNALRGKASRGGPRLRRATREETDAAILAKLDAYEKRLALPALPPPVALPAPVPTEGERDG